MAKVDSNVVALSYAREGLTTAGTKASTGWRQLEPNEISTFGAEITTIVREPISDNLQRRKGTITDFDSSVAFTADLTVDGLWDWLEGAVFAYSTNRVVRRLTVVSAAGANTDAYSVTGGLLGVGSDAVGKLGVGTLLWASEFSAAGNNGLKSIKTAVAGHASNAVAIAVNEEVTAAPAASRTIHGILQLAGYRIPAATAKTFAWDADGKQLTLTTTTAVVTALGKILSAGQTVHFGSVASVGGSIQNGVENNAHHGYARVLSVGTTTVVFDRVDEDLQGDAAEDSSNALDIIAGDFVRNVPRSHADYVQLSHTMELVSPDLFQTEGDNDAADDDGYEYATGQVVQSLAVEFPLTDKATMTVNLVGQDVDPPTQTRTPGAGAYDGTTNPDGTETKPDLTEAFNTSADFARLRITGVDDAGVTTDFKSLTLTITAQVTPEKALNTLGARFVNRGILLVDSEAQVIFSNPGVPAAIRNNTTLRMDAIVGNNDGVFVFELPSMTVGGGGREYPANAAVLLNTTGGAFEDEQFETSIHVSYMPVPIPTE